MWIQLTAEGTGTLTASEPSLLYALGHWLIEGLTEQQYARLEEGVLLPAGFAWNRPLFDTVLTQLGRSVRDFDEEAHIEHLARR